MRVGRVAVPIITPMGTIESQASRLLLHRREVVMVYCALLKIVDPELAKRVRPDHLAYVAEQYRRGRVMLAGPFADASGGLVVYQNLSADDAAAIAREDPAVRSGARALTLYAWDLLDLATLD